MNKRERLISQMLETAETIQGRVVAGDVEYMRAWKLAEAVIMLLDPSVRQHLKNQGQDADEYTIPAKYRTRKKEKN